MLTMVLQSTIRHLTSSSFAYQQHHFSGQFSLAECSWIVIKARRHYHRQDTRLCLNHVKHLYQNQFTI